MGCNCRPDKPLPAYLENWTKEMAHLSCDKVARYKKLRNITGLAVCVILLLALMAFLMGIIGCRQEAFAYDYSDTRIVKAIYLAEGDAKAHFAYGIRSIPYRTITEARQICLNSVRNGRKRWIKAGRPGDLIAFIGLRYSPPAINPNWVKLVTKLYWELQ